MDLARWSRRAEWALAGAVVLLHVAIFLWPERSGQPNFLVSTAHDAQLFSAIVLILAWTVLGPGWVWLRGAALPILLVVWYLPWNTRMVPRETADSFAIAVSIGAAVLVVGLRCCGQRVQTFDPPGGREKGAQFSLLALLAMTTLIAAAVGLLEWLRPKLAEGADAAVFITTLRGIEGASWFSPQNVRQVVMATAVAVAAVGAIWVVLRPGAVWLRLAALAIGVVVFGTYQAHLSGASTEQFAEVATNLALGLASVAALAGISALPLRLMDYRLQRPVKNAVSATAGPPKAAGRSRVMSRAAVLLALLVLIATGIPVANRIHRSNADRLEAPSQAFAHWIAPRYFPIEFTWEARSLEILDLSESTIYVEDLNTFMKRVDEGESALPPSSPHSPDATDK